MTTQTLKAPFPAFGGKSKVAKTVWERLGDVDNFVEPFCFSAAMLLLRPSEPKVETVNDLNAYVSNFWRAVQHDPEAVAIHADWPVNETDLHARHRWLVFSEEATEALERVRKEPEYFDAKVAGWWCWGACCWIGSGWCESQQLPRVSDSVGVNLSQKLPCVSAGNNQGVNTGPQDETTIQRRPNISGWSDRGVNAKGGSAEWQQRPNLDTHERGATGGGRIQLADAYSRGRGVNGNDSASTCEARRLWLTDWMYRLADRLRAVRICCGHWNRVCNSPSTTTRLGLTGVFLDPPYRKTVNGKKNRHGELYANDKEQDVDALCDEVQSWCLKWGKNKQVRIALCGYEGEYNLPDWDCIEWKASGGYGNQSGEVNENAARERIWFSPACVKPMKARQLF